MRQSSNLHAHNRSDEHLWVCNYGFDSVLLGLERVPICCDLSTQGVCPDRVDEISEILRVSLHELRLCERGWCGHGASYRAHMRVNAEATRGRPDPGQH